MQKQQLLKLLSISLLLTACGSDSSHSNSNSGDKIGYLVDSAVGGVEYRCGAKIGITGGDGMFSCPTLPVSFYIGSTKLGSIAEIPKDDNVFPQDIVGVDREKVEEGGVVKLATLLQSLDSDGDPSNGITVTSATREKFTSDAETLLENIELAELKEIHPDLELKDQEEVIAHLSFSMEALAEDDNKDEEQEAGVREEEGTDDRSPEGTDLGVTTGEQSGAGVAIGDDNKDDDKKEDDTSTGDTAQSSVTLPTGYTHRAINNQGVSVEGSVKTYTIRIYSENEEVANSQSLHQGVVVKVNGEASESIAIQSSYINKKIVIAVYDNTGKLVKVSDEILVSDDAPLVIVEMSLS